MSALILTHLIHHFGLGESFHSKNKTLKKWKCISKTWAVMTSKILRHNVQWNHFQAIHHFLFGSCPTVSKFIFTVFRDNSKRIIHRAMSSQFLQRVNGIFPNRLSFSVENKDPLRLAFLKQNGQKLSLDNFKGYFSSVTDSKWEARYLKHEIFSSPQKQHERSRKRRWEQSSLLCYGKSISDPPM